MISEFVDVTDKLVQNVRYHIYMQNTVSWDILSSTFLMYRVASVNARDVRSAIMTSTCDAKRPLCVKYYLLYPYYEL